MRRGWRRQADGLPGGKGIDDDEHGQYRLGEQSPPLPQSPQRAGFGARAQVAAQVVSDAGIGGGGQADRAEGGVKGTVQFPAQCLQLFQFGGAVGTLRQVAVYLRPFLWVQFPVQVGQQFHFDV